MPRVCSAFSPVALVAAMTTCRRVAVGSQLARPTMTLAAQFRGKFMLFGGKCWLAGSRSMQSAILASYSPRAGRPAMCDASSHARCGGGAAAARRRRGGGARGGILVRK